MKFQNGFLSSNESVAVEEKVLSIASIAYFRI